MSRQRAPRPCPQPRPRRGVSGGPSPPAQHDDAPGLGVDSAVVAVRPDTCREAEVPGHPEEKGSRLAAGTDAHGRQDGNRMPTIPQHDSRQQTWLRLRKAEGTGLGSRAGGV